MTREKEPIREAHFSLYIPPINLNFNKVLRVTSSISPDVSLLRKLYFSIKRDTYSYTAILRINHCLSLNLNTFKFKISIIYHSIYIFTAQYTVYLKNANFL